MTYHTQPAWLVSWLSPWLSLYTPLLFLMHFFSTMLQGSPSSHWTTQWVPASSLFSEATSFPYNRIDGILSDLSVLSLANGMWSYILEHINLNMWTTVHDISREHASSRVISLFSLSNECTLGASCLKAIEIPLEVKLSALNLKLGTRKGAS